MGNTASHPEAPAPAIARSYKHTTVKPPQDWNDDKSFLQISPQSDLSNPSQFRHRINDVNGNPLPRNPEPSSCTLSKVAPRSTQRQPGSIPQPAAFYFERQKEEEEDDQEPTPRSQMAINNKGIYKNSNKTWIAKKQQVVKKKTRRVKRVFLGCWQINRDALEGCVAKKNTDHELLGSAATPQKRTDCDSDAMHRIKTAPLNQEVPQFVLRLGKEIAFQPAVKGKNEMEKNPGLLAPFSYDEESSTDRMLVKSNEEPSTSDSRSEVRNLPTEDTAESTSQEECHGDSSGIRYAQFDPYGKVHHIKKQRESVESKSTHRQDNEDKETRHSTLSNDTHDSRELAIAETVQAEAEKTNDSAEMIKIDIIALKSKFEQCSSHPATAKKCPVDLEAQADARESQETHKSAPLPKNTTGVLPEQQVSALADGEEAGSARPEPCGNRKWDYRKSDQLVMELKLKHAEKAENEKSVPVMRTMLLQTYPFANGQFEEPRTTEDASTKTLETSKAFSLEPLVSPTVSATTPPTPASDNSKENVSKEAIKNATFLFSPSYAEGDESLLKLPLPHKGATPFSISTAGSRNRLVVRPRDYNIDEDNDSISVSTASTRCMRFSSSSHEYPYFLQDEEEKKIPPDMRQPAESICVPRSIKQTFSDLSDTTGFSRGSVFASTGTSRPHQESVTPMIPEERIFDHSRSSYDDDQSLDPPPPEEDYENEPNKHSSAGATGSSNSCTRWGYAMDNGVTPLRSNTAQSMNTTDSAFPRGTDSKTKFSGEGQADFPPVQPSQTFTPRAAAGSLVRSRIDAMEVKAVGGLVRSRVMTMEGQSAKTSTDENVTTLSGPPNGPTASKTNRRDTTGKEVIAPREAMLVSPHFPTSASKSIVKESNDMGELSTLVPGSARAAMAPAAIQGDGEEMSAIGPGSVHNSFDPTVAEGDEDEGSGVNTYVGLGSIGYDADASRLSFVTGADDRFGTSSLRQVTVHEDSSFENHSIPSHKSGAQAMFSKVATVYESEMDATVDDFAALLGDNDDEPSGDASSLGDMTESTMSTVRQQMPGIDRLLSSNPRFSDGNETALSGSSLDLTVSTVQRHRATGETSGAESESSTLSSLLKNTSSLPTRESTTVRPNEQVHRAVPGALCLSPMQKTPMQARKWRALAAAAQGKDSERSLAKSKFGVGKTRRSLSERTNEQM